MTDNIFVYRFNKMTNDELEAISFNEDVYTNEARLTALEILKSRDINSEAVNTAHSALTTESIANEKIVLDEIKEVTEPFDSNAKSDSEILPELYSKRLILMFSIFFSIIFGGALLMSNLKKTGHPKGRIHVLLFCICYAIIASSLISLFKLNPNLSLLANVVGGYILTEYFWNKHLSQTFEFKKRDWVRPLLISLAITIPLAYILIKSGVNFLQ